VGRSNCNFPSLRYIISERFFVVLNPLAPLPDLSFFHPIPESSRLFRYMTRDANCRLAARRTRGCPQSGDVSGPGRRVGFDIFWLKDGILETQTTCQIRGSWREIVESLETALELFRGIEEDLKDWVVYFFN